MRSISLIVNRLHPNVRTNESLLGLVCCLFGSLAYIFPTGLNAAENCMAYAEDAARMNCFEVFYKNANKDQKKNPSRSVQSPPAKVELPRTRPDVIKVQPDGKENREDVNSVLNNLAASHSRTLLGTSFAKEEEERRAFESTRLINACATAYCQYRLAPYQAAVDQYRNDPDNPAKREAEAELHWQFRMRANPPDGRQQLIR